jgi:predicted transcriptional regulator
LLAGINDNVEKNMWQVMRGLEETNIILTRIAHQLRSEGLPEKADEFRHRAAEIQQKAERIQQAIQDYKKLAVKDE